MEDGRRLRALLRNLANSQDVILRPVSLKFRLRKTLQAEGSITAAAREWVKCVEAEKTTASFLD